MDRKTEALKAFIGVRRTSDLLLKKARADAKQYGLNINEFAVLELLLHKGPCTVQGITEKILIANSSTSYIIDQLSDKGYVSRESHCSDRRVCIVSLTDEGKELISSLFPGHASMIEEAFSVLSDDEIDQFRNILKKISGHLSES